MYYGAYNLIVIIQKQRLLAYRLTALLHRVKLSFYLGNALAFPVTGILEPLTP